MKRGKISLGSPLVFRISKPTFDVDTAAQADLLIHESIFLSQIIQSGTVANPGGPSYTATIAIDPSLVNPIPIVYPIYGGNVAFPAPMAYLSGIMTTIHTNVFWSVSAGVLSIVFSSITPSASYAIIRQETP
ncbi:hypothetical protein [Mesorhizobium qingshengii]|uniref:Uncharacterized protein n=1 Tax=Mesorhizobium qingshengii TaxID=1165689 RepID=A0A1G5V232_9HYPH|nr:hypothetical protein [Mesorhizobium qingshengii]SDA39065.1 hypothetical protein SAMN02927914_00105 [Mesorhizobium qingshengii]